MKKLLLFIAATALTMSLVSCEKFINGLYEPMVVEILPSEDESSFSASFETDALTKTSLSENSENTYFNLSWSYGDKISITDGNTTSVYKTANSGNTMATFSLYEGSILNSKGKYTAFYPSTLSEKNLVLPSVQNYVYDNVENYPMMAVSESHDLKFKNLCGIISLNLKSETSITFKVSKVILSSPDKGMSGAFTVVNDVSVVDGTSGVTLKCTNPVSLYSYAENTFNVIVPQGSYNPLYITLVDADGDEVNLVSNAAVKVDRSGMTRLNITLRDSSFGSGLEIIPVTDCDVDFSDR